MTKKVNAFNDNVMKNKMRTKHLHSTVTHIIRMQGKLTKQRFTLCTIAQSKHRLYVSASIIQGFCTINKLLHTLRDRENQLLTRTKDLME